MENQKKIKCLSPEHEEIDANSYCRKCDIYMCNKCGEKLDSNFDKEKIDNLLNSNISQNNILKGIKEQIKNIINDININKNIENIKYQLNNIIFILEHLIEDIKKNNDQLKKLNNKNINNINNKNKININDVGNKNLNDKENNDNKEGGWSSYIKNALLNKEIDKIIYRNILFKAGIIGLNGAEWAKTTNFNIQKNEINKIIDIFKNKNNNIKTIDLENKEYEITNYETSSIDFKNGDIGGTIYIMNQGMIIGLYNSKMDYSIIKEMKKQNISFCHEVVTTLGEVLKGMKY